MTPPRTNQTPARLAAIRARFESKVDKNGPTVSADLGPCWDWLGRRHHRRGYGEVQVDGVRGAHRVAWFLANGRPPAADRMICHHCDRPCCVNPAHLYEGTAETNSRDSRERGRTAAGERNGSAKLSSAEARAIREAFAAGKKKTTIAREFGVTDVLVHRVVIGDVWKDAGGPIVPPVDASCVCSGCGRSGHLKAFCSRIRRAS